MSEFTNFDPATSLVDVAGIEHILNVPHMVVTKEFQYYVGNKEDNVYITIPQGYLTDGATAPPFLRRWLPAWGSYGAATIVHDYTCEYLSLRSGGRVISMTRARSDYIFYEAMKVLNVPLHKRVIMYLGVRAYSIIKARDKHTHWLRKHNLEIKLRKRFKTHNNWSLQDDWL